MILWKQIIQKCKADNIKSLIFVTNDRKEDWWWRLDGKTIGPRRELVEEIRQETGIDLFYMYSAERLLKYAGEYLDAKVSDISINQVRDISRAERLDRQRDFREKVQIAEDAFLNCLKQEYIGDEISTDSLDYGLDYVRKSQAGKVIGYRTVYTQNPLSASSRLRDYFYQGYFNVSKGKIDEMVIAFIFNQDAINEYPRITRLIRFQPLSETESIQVVLGYIDFDKKLFVPIYGDGHIYT